MLEKKKFHEANILKLNSNKAKSLLKWRPILSQKEMIKFVSDWYINLKNSNIFYKAQNN